MVQLSLLFKGIEFEDFTLPTTASQISLRVYALSCKLYRMFLTRIIVPSRQFQLLIRTVSKLDNNKLMADRKPAKPSNTDALLSHPHKTQHAAVPSHIGLDGHKFRINYDVPPEITKAFWELYNRRDVKYEDVSEELRKYEVPYDTDLDLPTTYVGEYISGEDESEEDECEEDEVKEDVVKKDVVNGMEGEERK